MMAAAPDFSSKLQHKLKSHIMDQRRSSLMFHLGQAHSKITSLEDYIREREKQFRSAVHRFERTDSRSMMGGGGGRLRRVGLSHNLLHMRTSSQEEEEQEEVDTYSRPLAEYALLKITKVINDNDEETTPFSLCRVMSREYHVGEGGVVIGSGRECEVTLPQEAGVEEKHVQIRWIPATPSEASAQLMERRGSRLVRQEKLGSDSKHSGHFELHDLTGGRGVFYVSHEPVTLQHLTIKEDDAIGDPSTDTTSQEPSDSPSIDNLNLDKPSDSNTRVIPVHFGVKFVAGKIEFSFTALPNELLYTLRMFAAARRGDLEELTNIIEASKSTEFVVPYVTVSPADNTNTNRFSTISVSSNQGADVNTEYQAPCYSDDAFFGSGFSRRRSSVHAVRNVTLLTPLSPGPSPTGGGAAVAMCSAEDHKLLLHIAIEKNHLEMVAYLISQNADVNQCVGELNRNALHLAALKNLPEVMLNLLRAGGDVEIRDSLHQQPLALTSDYRVRKLLVNTVLLCAAAEEGDIEEVVRLISTTHVSPNARGLRHKGALHLAVAKGHKQVVEFLLLNGAIVNAKGGSRRRTPLHYVSLNDHVEVAKVLLEAGANEFVRDSGGYTPLNLSMGGKMCQLLHKEPLSLCLAVQSGDIASVKRLLLELEGGPGGEEGDMERVVDQRNEQSHAPLHLACTSGHVEMVRVLVAHGASIGLHGGSDSWTPLMYAAMAGHGPVVEFLLSVGADSQEVDERGCTVSERVEQALEETKELLKQLETKIRAGTQPQVETSLHTLEPASMIRQESGSSFSYEAERAWLKGRYDKLKTTLDVLTSGPDRFLKCIETKNHTEFVELLKSGVVSANVMVDKHSPSSALVRVCENGLYKFAVTLIEYGAEVSQCGPADQIPVMVAAADGNVDLLKLLHDSNADINIQSEDTLNTPLHEAATANSTGCVAYLLSVGARLDVCNISGETPFDCSTLVEVKKMLAVGPNKLLLAASIGDTQLIQQLITEEGISPSHVFPLGVTALHEASEAGQVEAVRLFIEHGADVNKQVHATMVTPLHLASQNNHIEIAKLLISGGAKLDMKDMEGKVPFEVACSNQMRKVLVEARTVRTQPVVREGSDTERRCMICMDNPINTIVLPCGHEAFCTNCVSRISTCALDRQTIREVITVFK